MLLNMQKKEENGNIENAAESDNLFTTSGPSHNWCATTYSACSSTGFYFLKEGGEPGKDCRACRIFKWTKAERLSCRLQGGTLSDIPPHVSNGWKNRDFSVENEPLSWAGWVRKSVLIWAGLAHSLSVKTTKDLSFPLPANILKSVQLDCVSGVKGWKLIWPGLQNLPHQYRMPWQSRRLFRTYL